MSSFPRSPFTVTFCFFILCGNLLIQVENKSVFGIGTRIIGDQLLMKDVLQSPPISLTEEPVIKFNYAIKKPITYIEIESDKNAYAIVNFSYEDELIEGTISSINGEQDKDNSKPEPFEVLIQIYGLNETMPNVNPAYILNKDQQFNGVLRPNYQQQQNHQYLNLMQEDLNALDDLEDYDAAEENDDDDDDYDEDDFNGEYDKIIEQGQRQEGDFLVYETNQTSSTTTEELTNHSIVFYYIDIYFITYVKFTLYEHYLDNPLDNNVPPVVEYGHISPTTLKAVVTDHHTTSLFVQMQMYGFHPTALPVDYKPFLSNGQTATTRPISSLRQLKILMNAQNPTTATTRQQSDTNGGIQQHQPNELGHQISPSNNSNVNCVQQVLSSSSSSSSSSSNIGSDTLSAIAHLAISKLIVTIFATIIYM